MELGAHVWLRKEDSHWGWVPAVVTKKEPVTVSGVELINLTLNDDPNIEMTMPQQGRSRANSYFANQKRFQVMITVDPEQLKTADHEDIKLRNLPTSFQLSGEDPEAGVITSPSTKTNSAIVGGVDDLIGLTHLHEPAILHSLRLRYDSDIIYTATGPILIAVNPFKRMDNLYSTSMMEKYCEQGEKTTSGSKAAASTYTTPFKNRNLMLGNNAKASPSKLRLAPHVYQTGDDAYRAMLRGLENNDLMMHPNRMTSGENGIPGEAPTNQSILVSGESGAGKTVTTKIILNYFAMLSKRRHNLVIATPRKGAISPVGSMDEENVSIEQQVLQSNPILESFGNARTIRNDNSSRFGKFVDIRFTRSGRLSGASIETYLLEKVRLIHPGVGERNYHIFYQFLSSATPKERSDFGIGDMEFEDFKLLSQTGTYDRRDGVCDSDNHKEMLNAMTTMGFKPEKIQSLMRLVAGILFGGNMTFTPSGDGDSCRLDKTQDALNCASLLGISFEGLAAALTARVILAGDEIVHKPLTIEESAKAAEALLKTVYGAAFDYIVEKVNKSIGKASGETASIGVLDIFGFETFETNSFEQLCINYTNEALQQQFNKYVFKMEQREYEREGIMWKFISFPDNQDVLDLIDKKHIGILRLLDEQCILPKSTDEKFTRYLYGRCDKHDRFKATSAQRVDYLFSIKHYAGYVEYTTESWIEKNKDQLPAASSDLLRSSDFDLIGDVQRFIRTEDRAGRGTIATKSVSSQFSTQLRELRARIDVTVPHYIRCLKPNDDLAPNYFEPKNVVEQLRCGGVIEAVRVSRAGYPTRYPHEVFMARYNVLGDNNDVTPQSPVFSPSSQTEKESTLKRLISKVAFDLWYADHQNMKALLLADQNGRATLATPTMLSEKRSNNSVKSKLCSGPYAPPVNLVVESSVRTPESKKYKTKKDPTAAMRDRHERHNVARPEDEDEFLSLDFASRCAIAGLQLGRTKVFLRREAFDRIEAMRSDKFFSAASSIQKLFRGKLARVSYLRLRRTVIAATKIQKVWRGCAERLIIREIDLARRYAATMIQRFYREYKMKSYQPSEDDIIRAVITIQAIHRGSMMRAAMVKAQRQMLKEVPPGSPPVVTERAITPVKYASEEVSTTIYNDPLTSSLFREIQAENWATVESILDSNPELAESPDQMTGELALHKIVRHNGAWTLLIDMVLVLFPKALVHRDNMGALPIHHASAHDNLAALEIIYSAYKEGINEKDQMGRLPIHVAANYDAVDSVKFLLSKSPEGSYTMVYRPPPDSGGGLPLHLACGSNASIGVITALLAENFASAKRADENGDLPLHLLLRCGEAVDPVVVKTLLTCFSGALSRTDMSGDLPLAIAIKHQCRSPVINAVLMQHPAAAGLLNGEGHSPLFLAFEHCADDRTIMGLLNHAPKLATAVDKKSGLLPIQVATENEHSHFIVHNLLKRDMPIDTKEKVRARLVPHKYSWNHVVSNTNDLYFQVVTKILQSCTQPQVLALSHIEGPDGKIALASATPVCKYELRVMLRLFNTLEVVNQTPAYTNPASDTQIFYALRYDPPAQSNGEYTIIHEEKKDGGENDYVEDYDDHSHISALSRNSIRSSLTSRSQQPIEEKLRKIRKEKGQQVIAKLTSRSDVVERELKVRKDFQLSRHYVPAIISVHHTVQHAAYSEAMAEPGYCITMEGADTTAENLMLDMRKSGKSFPSKALKRIGISLLHMHEHGIIHGDFGTHNIGKFGSRWKLLGVGGSVPIGSATSMERGFYHPPESIAVENKRSSIGKKSVSAKTISIKAQTTFDIWAFGVVVYEAIAGFPLAPYACRGKRDMTKAEISRIGLWDESSLRKALKALPEDNIQRDLVWQLLHPYPYQRASSMRIVLEHPFFTGGSVARNHISIPIESRAASPDYSVDSNPSVEKSNNKRESTSTRSTWESSVSGHQSMRSVNHHNKMDSVVVTESRDSIENRENYASRSSKWRPSSPSGNSVRSGRSIGGGFRKLRTSLKRQNIN